MNICGDKVFFSHIKTSKHHDFCSPSAPCAARTERHTGAHPTLSLSLARADCPLRPPAPGTWQVAVARDLPTMCGIAALVTCDGSHAGGAGEEVVHANCTRADEESTTEEKRRRSNTSAMGVGAGGDVATGTDLRNGPSLAAAIRRRGPDSFGLHRVCDGQVTLLGSVLRLRGQEGLLQAQPCIDALGNVLLWNGELYAHPEWGDVVDNPAIRAESDTAYVSATLERLAAATRPAGASSRMDSSIGTALLAFFSKCRGPWAFIWWHAAAGELWYGRDPLGRRSLVVQAGANGFHVASVAACKDASTPKDGAIAATAVEVSCRGLYCLSLTSTARAGPSTHICKWTPSAHPLASLRLRSTRDEPGEVKATSFSAASSPASCAATAANSSSSQLGSPPSAQNLLSSSSSMALLQTLDAAVRRRILGLAPERGGALGILFSGGLDCTVLAALAARHWPDNLPIELLNVCFDPGRASPDRRSAVMSSLELEALFPQREWKFVAIDIDADQVEADRGHVSALVQPRDGRMDMNIGAALWYASRGRGCLLTTGRRCELAAGFASPVLEALRQMVEQESRARRRKSSRSQMAQDGDTNDTTMDDAHAVELLRRMEDACGYSSSGTVAKWKAAAGANATAAAPASGAPYQAAASVLLSGLGADELMAGYGRHKTAFRRGGSALLEAELLRDVERLPFRNHGRDDRVISDNGREVRFPYLDESVINLLASMPLAEITDMSLHRGAGDKLILRKVAQELGLQLCAVLPKRALQFGSRIVQAVERRQKRSRGMVPN